MRKITAPAKQIKRLMFVKTNENALSKFPNCENCETPFLQTPETHIGFGIFEGISNKALCHTCCDLFVKEGAQDIDLLSKNIENERRFQESEILRMNNKYSEKELVKKTFKDVADIYNHLIAKENETKILNELIEKDFVPTYTEQYLFDDYGLHEYDDLKHETQIKEYFYSNDFEDLFDCGIGYSIDKVVILVKIGAKFYYVTIEAEVIGERSNHSDKVYHVDCISNVSYVETEKPLPKERKDFVVTFKNITDNQKTAILSLIEDYKCEYEL
jgi:hypothetical protein